MAKKFDFKRIGMKVVGVGAGAVVGKIADKPLANMNPKLRSIIKIGVGAVVPELVKSEFVGSIGAGILAVGAADLYDSMVNKTTTAPVQGVGEVYDTAVGSDEDYIITEQMTGVGENPDDVLAGLGSIDQEEE
jgi:hypothetical protein